METNKKEKEEYLSTNLNIEFSICCKNCGEKNYGKYTIIKKANINENIDLIPILDIYKKDQNQMSIAYTVQNKYNGVSEEQEIANAKIISKAPEMLDMLKAIVKANDWDMLHQANFEQIKKLINEATEI